MAHRRQQEVDEISRVWPHPCKVWLEGVHAAFAVNDSQPVGGLTRGNVSLVHGCGPMHTVLKRSTIYVVTRMRSFDIITVVVR
jgi:hypothetical protein